MVAADNKQPKKALFPDVWWKDSHIKFGGRTSTRAGTTEKNDNDNGNDSHANGSSARNYGSTHETISYEPLVDEETQEPSFVIPSDFPQCVVDDNGAREPVLFGNNPVDVQSDISNRSSSSSSNDDESGCDRDSDYDSSDEEIELEQPHRTLGLIFFDFLRFVAISANLRMINTQMVPVFLAWGKMEILHVALR